MPGQIKIVFYAASLSEGGAERVQVLLANGFAGRGHDVVFVADRMVKTAAPLHPGVRLVVLQGGHARDVFALAAVFRRENPDIVISALAYCNLKATAAALLAGCSSRLVLTYHGFAESEAHGLSRIGYSLVPVLSRLTAATVAVSDGLKNDLLARFRSAGGHTLRIYNPVSAGDVPEKMDLAVLMAREPMVLAVGRLVPAKGFLNLLRAFARLEEPNARLVILGSGPQREELLAEISRLGLEQRVNLPGHVNEPWSFFKQARCLVSASHMESFGLVLVEAMAHGLPVVSTDCGATAEVLESGRFGSLVPVGDEARLAAAIQKALSDPGDPAPRRAHATTFSTAAALDEYERLIDRITEGTSPLPA